MSSAKALSRLERVLVLVLAALAGGCRSRRLPVRGGCQMPEVVSCLQPYAFEELDPGALERVAVEAIRECFANDEQLLMRQSTCLPLEMGVDRQTGKKVELRYFCSDVCPGVVPIYRDEIDAKACCRLGGFPLFTILLDHYVGCLVGSARKPQDREKACGDLK